MFDNLFALFHFLALAGLFFYAVYSIITGNLTRGIIILILLGVYFYFVLWEAVKKEVARRKSQQKK